MTENSIDSQINFSELEYSESYYYKKDDSTIRITSVENGIVLPFKKENIANSNGAGGVLDQKNNFITTSGLGKEGFLKYGNFYSYNKSELEIYNEEVIWFGLYIAHWGHFLIELIGRMWYILENYHGQKIIYISKTDRIEKNFLEFFNYMGIKKEKLVRISNPTKFTNIVIPDYAGTEYYYSQKYIEIFNTVIKNSDYIHSEFQVPDQIYLSRKHFFESHWKDIGEHTIEKIFNKNGYKSICPEKCSLKDQIKLWNSSSIIACINGTIPMNLVFTRTNTKLIVLNKTSRKHSNLIKLQNAFNYQITYIDVFYKRYAHLVKHMGSGPFLIYNSPYFRKFCKTFNLLNNKEGLFLYPIKATFYIFKFKYFNYFKFLLRLKYLYIKMLNSTKENSSILSK